MTRITAIITLWITVGMVACADSADKNTGGSNTGRSGSSTSHQKIERNRAINTLNAYNDLFMDSATLEDFIAKQKLSDTIIHDMRDFYNARNFQFAWFSSDGLAEQTFAFRSLYDYTKDDEKKKVLDNKLDNLMLNDDSLTYFQADDNITKTELLLTWRFIQYLWDTYPDEKIREKVLLQFVPAQKKDIMARAEATLKDDHVATNAAYEALKKQLENYVAIAKKGGWPTIPENNKKYKTGQTDSILAIVKKRLQVTGQLPANDTSAVFTPGLENSVRALQSNYGFTVDGIIQPALVKELNKPVQSRLQQLMINMERMRWRPVGHGDRMILVNIPEFMLHVWEGKTKVFDMEVIVGKQGHGTVMFSGDLDQVVFSPYWNVPESIVRNEIQPSVAKNPNYLQQNDMEVTGETNGLPVVRQLPGDKNELGKVKFLFPNSFNIYLHDTPNKELFKKSQRAYSHGCIRLADAEKMAAYLLKDNPEWTPEKIQEAMNSAKEKYVKIKDPVPVLVTYYTAWVDENGTLQFRKDIYGHDKTIANRLFSNATVIAGASNR
jgi:murein L,D-transpeptidase YcbB/YkuD